MPYRMSTVVWKVFALSGAVWVLPACGTEDSGDTGDELGETVGDSGDVGESEAGDDGDTGAACPVANFPSVSPDPANAAYDAPTLDVYCEGDEVVVVSNGIPAYEFVALTPNDLEAQDWEWHFPLYPEVAENTAEIPLLGAIGIAVNGLPIYGPNEGAMPDPYGDPVYNDIVDFCDGHTGPTGDYHYHALLVDCLTQGAVDGEPSPVIAYGFDGFPVYGPQGCADSGCAEVVTYRSGWVQTGDPTTYSWDNHEYQSSDDPTVLDACNGHVGPGGDYHYHATDSFPYVQGCYAGSATANTTGGPP